MLYSLLQLCLSCAHAEHKACARRAGTWRRKITRPAHLARKAFNNFEAIFFWAEVTSQMHQCWLHDSWFVFHHIPSMFVWNWRVCHLGWLPRTPFLAPKGTARSNKHSSSTQLPTTWIYLRWLEKVKHIQFRFSQMVIVRSDESHGTK